MKLRIQPGLRHQSCISKKEKRSSADSPHTTRTRHSRNHCNSYRSGHESAFSEFTSHHPSLTAQQRCSVKTKNMTTQNSSGMTSWRFAGIPQTTNQIVKTLSGGPTAPPFHGRQPPVANDGRLLTEEILATLSCPYLITQPCPYLITQP